MVASKEAAASNRPVGFHAILRQIHLQRKKEEEEEEEQEEEEKKRRRRGGGGRKWKDLRMVL